MNTSSNENPEIIANITLHTMFDLFLLYLSELKLYFVTKKSVCISEKIRMGEMSEKCQIVAKKVLNTIKIYYIVLQSCTRTIIAIKLK